jgi:NADH/NAD ratio-sensing transcriptional regulator Rex
MSTLQKIASDLADDAVSYMQETGEDRFYYEVATVLGAASQTLEEAFLTEVRVRLAGNTAKAFIEKRRAALKA